MQRLKVPLECLEGGRRLLIIELRSRVREIEACLRVEVVLRARAHNVRVCIEAGKTIS